MISKQMIVLILTVWLIIGTNCRTIGRQNSKSLDFCQSFARNDFKLDYGFGKSGNKSNGNYLVINDMFWEIKINMPFSNTDYNSIEFVSQLGQQSTDLSHYKMAVPVLNETFTIFIDKNNKIYYKRFSDRILTDLSLCKPNQTIRENYFLQNYDYIPFYVNLTTGCYSGGIVPIDTEQIVYIQQKYNSCNKTFKREIINDSIDPITKTNSTDSGPASNTTKQTRYNPRDLIPPFSVDRNNPNNSSIYSNKFENSKSEDTGFTLDKIRSYLNKTINLLYPNQTILAIFSPINMDSIESSGHIVLIETGKTVQYMFATKHLKFNFKTLINCSAVDLNELEYCLIETNLSKTMAFVFALIGAVVISCLYVILILVYRKYGRKLRKPFSYDLRPSREDMAFEINPAVKFFNLTESQIHSNQPILLPMNQ